MPSLAAAIIASIAGWIIDAAIEPFIGIGARLFVGFVAGTFIYYCARNWLLKLRDG